MSDRIKDENEIIQTYFAPLSIGAPGAFGLRDDAAVISVPAGSDLVVSNDPVIAGVHFFADDQPRDIAWKALAVNVSDLVAKGAKPLAYTMALAFPDAPTKSWMTNFAAGLKDAQNAFGCYLTGGDTDRTTGPLSIGITAFGTIDKGRMIPRHGAKSGDHVFVTGTIGDSALGLLLHSASAALALESSERDKQFLLDRYLRPQPRVALIDALRAHAHTALDISDGLLKDVARLVGEHGLVLNIANVPLSHPARAMLDSDPKVIETILTGGCDYEVAFAVAPQNVNSVREAASRAAVDITDIGSITSSCRGVAVVDATGEPLRIFRSGYDHFSAL